MKKIIYSGPTKDFLNPSAFVYFMEDLIGINEGWVGATVCGPPVCLESNCEGGWIGVYHFDPDNVMIQYYVHNIHSEDYGQVTLTLFGKPVELGAVEKIILDTIERIRR